MPKRKTPRTFPDMLVSLGAASFQTIALRSAMIATNACSAAEYQRMMREKAAAALQSSLLLASWPPATPSQLLLPWHAKATANARRLGRRRAR